MVQQDYYEIPKERKEFIRKYLRESSCSTATKGFNVLMHVISIAADHPNYTCQQMFEEYMYHVTGNEGQNWKIPYSQARYCYMNGLSQTRTMHEFIMDAVVDMDAISA